MCAVPAPLTGKREAEVWEAAAELTVACGAMKDGDSFRMCCLLRGGGEKLGRWRVRGPPRRGDWENGIVVLRRFATTWHL